MPRDQLPEPEPVRFGQAEPYCVRWESGERPEAEFADFASAVTAGMITRLASQVWWKRATSPRLENTDGDPLLLMDATITVSGDVAGQLLAHADFAEEDGGGAVDAFRVEALLRQLEYQAGLATARGQRGIDVAWLRAEFGRVR